MTPKAKRVLCFGTFDYFHAGHQYYLSQAAKLGDELYVIIARDETVKQIKGFKPDHDQEERRKTVAAFAPVTKAVIGNKSDKYQVIKTHKPDVICLGYDQYAFTQTLQKKLIELDLNTEVTRLPSFKPELYKSSLIKKQQVESAQK